MIPQHAIRRNDSARQPRRFVWLDTEAREVTTGSRRTQTWRLAVTAYDGWSEKRGAPLPVEWQAHETPEELWAYVTGKARRRARQVLTCHNLAYDLRISRAFHLLPPLGWEVYRLGLHDRAMTVTWRDSRGATLVMVDSYSWLPMSLERVGQLLGIPKQPLPDQASDEGWLERCTTDVQILRAAMGEVWGWVEQADLGTWQRTGAGMAATVWRHQHYTHRVVVHDQQAAQEAEALSMFAGRCEAWRHGRLPRETWYEYDLSLAHARIGAELSVPVSLVSRVHRVSTDRALACDPRWRYLVEAEVAQELPVLPVVTERGIVWPEGLVRGWWWDTELALARAEGAGVEVRSAWRYAGRPALASVSRWMVDAVEGDGQGLTPVQRAAVKHWARALYGRFATRYQVWEHLGPAQDDAVYMMPLYDRESGERWHLLQMGNETKLSTGERYGTDACVAIYSAVLAECRIRLWQLMRHAGLEHVAYVDTDSVVVDAAGAAALEELIRQGGAWGLRLKARTTSVEILGPRQLRFGRSSRFAGIPTTGRRLRGGEWQAERWESMRAALGGARADSVVITGATWVRRGADHRRRHLPGGYTAAYTLLDPPIPSEAPRRASDGRRGQIGPRVAVSA